MVEVYSPDMLFFEITAAVVAGLVLYHHFRTVMKGALTIALCGVLVAVVVGVGLLMWYWPATIVGAIAVGITSWLLWGSSSPVARWFRRNYEITRGITTGPASVPSAPVAASPRNSLPLAH